MVLRHHKYLKAFNKRTFAAGTAGDSDGKRRRFRVDFGAARTAPSRSRLVFLYAPVFLIAPAVAEPAGSPFAASVIEYAPAPGQFVNVDVFNDPTEALGPPSGGGTVDGADDSVVTLGGFGGSITLGFDHTVEDDPFNPFGMDAIVFGNAFLVGGDSERHWAECATIEICLDVNCNGQADDPWDVIPGSHIVDPEGQYAAQTWDDNTADDTYPPSLASWIPPGLSGVWTTEGYLLPPEIFAQVPVINPAGPGDTEGIFGYAEYSPTLILGDMDADNIVDDPVITPEEFYTVPDNPMTVGVTPGSGGGDALDIAWAIDALTGLPADLPGFDFIRITNGVNTIVGPLGELSPEIDAVADVRSTVPPADVPTVSEWGLVALTLLLLTAGTLVINRRAEVGR